MCPSLPASSSAAFPSDGFSTDGLSVRGCRGLFRRLATADDLGRNDHLHQRPEACRFDVRQQHGRVRRPLHVRRDPRCSSPGAGISPSRGSGTWPPVDRATAPARCRARPGTCARSSWTARATATRIAASSRAPSSASWRPARWRRRPRRPGRRRGPRAVVPPPAPKPDAPATDCRRRTPTGAPIPTAPADLDRTHVALGSTGGSPPALALIVLMAAAMASVMSLRWRSRGRYHQRDPYGRRPPQLPASCARRLPVTFPYDGPPDRPLSASRRDRCARSSPTARSSPPTSRTPLTSSSMARRSRRSVPTSRRRV